MLLTSRTPLRVSFFGGGTDYPEYFARHPGAVVGMAINKYIYISVLKLTNIIDYRYRLSYSIVERALEAGEIVHPVVRCVLQHFTIDEALDINVMAELPASSGLGSSSAFTVGFLNVVAALRGQSMTRLDLGRQAIRVERELLNERVGVQDQLHAAFGGINRFDFIDGRIRITPVQMVTTCRDHLMQSLVLVYTGVTRHASEILERQIQATKENQIDRELSHLLALTAQAVDVLEGPDPERMLTDFGRMMGEGWQTKRKLSQKVSSPEIDALYENALAAGALGGKLCGAGGGGFLLVVVPPHKMSAFKDCMRSQRLIPINMDHHGSTILTG